MAVAMPTSIRKPLIDTEAEEADIGETCEFEAGEALRAPIYRSVPTTVSVRWHMTQAQFDDFDEWFEDDLLAANLTFNLPVLTQGSDLTALQEAMFLEMPECVYVHKDNWEVSARCVIGVSFQTLPVIPAP